MGVADSGAPDWMIVVDLLVELPEGVACPWILSRHPIRDQLEGWGSLSWSRYLWSE